MGEDVPKDQFAIGMKVGVGCMVDSCMDCSSCDVGDEHYCKNGNVGTYNKPEKRWPKNLKDHYGTADNFQAGGITYGGYSDKLVCRYEFVLKIPDKLDLATSAPILCAGVTMYSPMKKWNLQPGQTLGIVGLGGLGHLGLKIGKAMGCKVVVVSHSAHKREEATGRLGADDFIVSSDEEQMKAGAGSIDMIIDTVSAAHQLSTYMPLLAAHGKIVLVGVPTNQFEISPMSLLFGEKVVAGSVIGNIHNTQEILDFCAEHSVAPDCEIQPASQANECMKRLAANDVRYRFVLDMQGL
jgi:uncharacterized zinc-type alcohol dehydrogenase-like protein